MKKRWKIFPLPIPGQTGSMTGMANIVTDPQGSYTGRPADLAEVPVQDVDDL